MENTRTSLVIIKIIAIIACLFLITIESILLAIQRKVQTPTVPTKNQQTATPGINELRLTPTVAEIKTGAILQALPQEEKIASEELFRLLDQPKIIETGFTIDPHPKERKIYITLRAPTATNKNAAQLWLTNNGYSNIAPAYLLYQE